MRYMARPITDPKGRVLSKPWGVWERLMGNGWALRSKHATKAEAAAEANRLNAA